MEQENSRQGLQFIDQSTKMAEEIADYFSWWTALYISGNFLPLVSEFKEAHKRFQQCLDFSLALGHKGGIAPAKSGKASCSNIEGKINDAYKIAQEALTVAKKTDNALAKGIAYTVLSSASYHKGLFNDQSPFFRICLIL